jgi:hypothetical protein
MYIIALRQVFFREQEMHWLFSSPQILSTPAPAPVRQTVEHPLMMSAGFNTNTLPDFYNKDAIFDRDNF